MSVPRLLNRIHVTRRHLDAAGTGHPLLLTACIRPVPITDSVVASVFADKPPLDFCVSLFVRGMTARFCVGGSVAVTWLTMK